MLEHDMPIVCTTRSGGRYTIHQRREDVRRYRNAVLRTAWCPRCNTLLATSWEPHREEVPR